MKSKKDYVEEETNNKKNKNKNKNKTISIINTKK